MGKIRTNDEVIVLTGKDKGKRGTVASVVDADHIIVNGVNVAKKVQPVASSISRCQFTCQMLHCSMRQLARQIASVLKMWTVRKSAYLNPAAKLLRFKRSWPVSKNSIKKKSLPT
jgi:ribosomal protein L24